LEGAEQVDFFASATPPSTPGAVTPTPTVPTGPRIFSVSEIARDLKETLRKQYTDILIQGEICDFKGVSRSGHLYCGLKDNESQIRAVVWKSDLSRIPFELKAGLEVIVTGKLDFYGGSGSLQLVVTRMEPVGIGALQLKFEQLKAKLSAEGLFDVARKRRVAPLNWRIGVVTSRSTAALQDILKVFRTRFPLAEVFLFNCAVQGDKAPAEITKAIQVANRWSLAQSKPLDVLIVGRGGGSYEDLFCFNDEGVARAIVASTIPVVSAVGHEIDVTIADMVADFRAATPSQAAERTVPDMQLWLERLSELERQFGRRALDRVRDHSQRVDLAHSRILQAAPQKRLELQKAHLRERALKLSRLMQTGLQLRRQNLARLSQVLDALSPLRVYERGFLTAQGPRGLVRTVHDVQKDDELTLRLRDGHISARVVRTEPGIS
jgi:exodeoxyribonuclease VII large subunit